ncbi:MAG: hemerythrin domain-containing protein [Betaproteobacteria bacterium]|nr:hemerythrin domain-containing protein [Betaproteobacteria bacterium]
MIDQVAAWHQEHVRFSQLLDLLDKEVAVFHEGGEPNYELMRDIVFYLRHYSDRFHHPREDVAFARLAERDPDLRVAINRLVQEHQVIAVAGEELLHRLDDIEANAVVSRKAVESAAATYLVYYRHHIATEEKDVLPRAEKLLTREDWKAVASAVPNGADPLFGDKVEARYDELRRQVMREGREA